MLNQQPILIPWKNPIYDLNEYRLSQDFPITVNGLDLLIAEGFGYDGATIPSVAWQLIYSRFDPIMMLPSLVHDWLYTTHYQMPNHQAADDIFVELCRQNGVPGYKCFLIGAAVKTVGGFFWETKDKDRAYLAYLRQYIIDSGRNPDRYHLPSS